MPLKLSRRGRIWYLRGTIRGVRIYESTQTDRPEAAEDIRIQREKEILDRSIYGPSATATFSEAVVMYLEAGGEQRYMKPLLDHFRAVPLSRIDQTAIDRAARVLYPDAMPATLNRHVYTPISAVLHDAARRGLCDTPRIRRPKQPAGRIRSLEPVEYERLIDACAPHLRPLLVFLFYTGARVSEALYLDWRQIDLTRRHTSFEKTKNGEARGVPLHPQVVIELAGLMHRDGAVFRTQHGRPYKARNYGGGQIKTAFKAACRRANIFNFHPHDCRHTWATWHYRANRNISELMALGGWKSVEMVMRYTHVNTDHLQDGINRLPSGANSVQLNKGAA
jgi:integrase